MKKLYFLCAMSLAGCASTTSGPMVAGPDTFMISRQAGAAFPSGREPLMAEAMAEAGVKCSSLGKSIKLISASENPGPFILGNYPKATVLFSCM